MSSMCSMCMQYANLKFPKYTCSSMLKGLVSSVGRVSEFTVCNHVIGGTSASWDSWSQSWNIIVKCGVMFPLTLDTKKINNDIQRVQDCIAECLVLCMNGSNGLCFPGKWDGFLREQTLWPECNVCRALDVGYK